MIEKKHVHIGHILHIDEVAPEFPAAFKQAQLPGLADLVMELVYHRRHLALVILLRAVDVEIAQPHHLHRQVRPAAAEVLIELKFGISVDVKRIFAAALFPETVVAVAVNRGRGCVNKTRFTGDGKI